MDTRQIGVEIAKQQELNAARQEQAVQDEIARKAKKEQENNDMIEIEKQWYPAVKKLAIDEISKLLSRMATLSKDAMGVTDYSEGSDCTFKGRLYRFAIACAINANHVDLLKLILNADPDPDLDPDYPCQSDDRDLVYPLIYALLKKSEQCATLLINRGANPNTLCCNTMDWGGAFLMLISCKERH